MHALDESPAVNRDANQLPGFLFPSQVATLMLVETEDLIPLIAPIVWPIFGAVMAFSYPTQVLSGCERSVAVHSTFRDHQWSPAGSHLGVSSAQRCQSTTPHGLYGNQGTKTGGTQLPDPDPARARCALPLPLEFHPVSWLHAPLDPNNGAVATFVGWDEQVVMRVLNTVVQRLGGRKSGEGPAELHHSYVCDTSRMYCIRAEPRIQTARILDTITCWSKPELVGLAIHQQFQHMKRKFPR